MARKSPSSSEVVDRLISASQHHAREAVVLASRDWSFMHSLDVAYRAGATVELLAKVVLARRDQRLLAKAAHEHLLDVVSGTKARDANLKTTLDASVAVTLAARADARIAAREKGARVVLSARNAAVHLADAPTAGQVRIIVAEMVAVADAFLAAEAMSAPEFWGSQHDTATTILQCHVATVAVETRALVEKARQAYQQRINSLPDDAQPGVVALLQDRGPNLASTLADEAMETACPSCGNEALALYDFEVYVEDDHGEPVYSSGYLLTGLVCPVCDLHLDSDHVETLEGLPNAAEVEAHVTERDFDDYYEYE